MYTGMTLGDYINLYMLVLYAVQTVIAVLLYLNDTDNKK